MVELWTGVWALARLPSPLLEQREPLARWYWLVEEKLLEWP